MNEFAQYIGIPWQPGAQGPNSYDCMGFFRFIQKKHFNIDVPIIIAPDYDNPTVLVAVFKTSKERANWAKLEHPFHGCAVLIHRPMHIGVWLDIDGGGVLHCARNRGVIFTKDSNWHNSGYGRKEYFRHN